MTKQCETPEKRIVKMHRALSLYVCVLAALYGCNRKPAEPSPDRAEQKASEGAQASTWRFVVSGDSRDCGDLVMPAIAADAAKLSPAFYWHLGDYRAIYKIDEDMEHLSENPSGHLTLPRYEKTAWDDFLKNQITPFGAIPVFLGIGNHEMILHKDREDFIAKFRSWLDSPTLQDQRLKDDPSDHRVKTYFHWVMGGVDFISLDNASREQFDGAQMKWFRDVLTRDKSNAQIQTLVVGMHAALPESISRGHSMSESEDGEKSGIQVYKELLSAQNDAHKRVYVLASHSHFFMDGVYNTEYWRQNGGVLPGWIVGTAGAVRYPLPENWKDAQQAMTKVYGYVVATVNPEVQKNGAIRFEFRQLEKQHVPPSVAERFTPAFVDWCFDENVQAQNDHAKPRPTHRRTVHK
jgi:Calcineurin-like phosphoesterase